MSDLAYNKTTNALNAIINVLSYVPYLGFNTEQRGEIPNEPLILAINHKLKALVNPFLADNNKRTRFIDHLIVGAKYPKQIHFAVQDIQFMKPPTRKYLEEIGSFPVHRLRKGLEFLSKGETVGIFPQGEAHLMEEGVLYKGAAWLSAKSKRRILPVYISKNSKEINNILHPKLSRIYIDYLSPLEPPKSACREDLELKVKEFEGVFELHKKYLICQGLY